MTEEEIKKFAKEYVQNNTDESVNSFQGEQLQKAFIEGTDFMYYSNNEELKNQLTEKDKRIAELEAYNEKLLDGDIEKHNKIVKLEKGNAELERHNEEVIALINAERERQEKCNDIHLLTIAELDKENTELKDKLNNLASVAEVRLANWQKLGKENKALGERCLQLQKDKGKLIDENNELKTQIEKMKSDVELARDNANKTEDWETFSVLNSILDDWKIKEK